MVYSDLMVIISAKVTGNSFTEPQMTLALQEVEQAILNYCDISIIPDALKFTWCNLSIDLLNYNLEINKNVLASIDTIDIREVTNIKIGDTSVQLGGSSSILKGHKANLDGLLMNYNQQLNMFRRLW